MSQNSMLPTRWLSLSGRELRVVGVVALVALATSGVTYMARYYLWHGGMTVQRQEKALPRPERLNVNTARGYELELLPGIGPKTAAKILKYRRANGNFADLSELKNVKGIGPATVDDIRPQAMCAEPDEHIKKRK